jgi:CelD/BcsL family acetyltransferase involved in cellulose biosynthesis
VDGSPSRFPFGEVENCHDGIFQPVVGRLGRCVLSKGTILLNIRCVTADRLTDEEILAWSQIQRANSFLSSPFFRPEFALAVAAVRTDVEVAVLEEDGRHVGFLPFQRVRRTIGRPVGGLLSDYHGLIKDADVHVAPEQLVRACRLSVWHFNNLVDPGTDFSQSVRKSDESWIIDLAGGFDRYIDERDNGVRIMTEYRRKASKLARDAGPIRFEFHNAAPAIVDTLLKWKRDQYGRTGVIDIFRFEWVRRLVPQLLQNRGADFECTVSVMRCGEMIAAITLFMRSGDVMHAWFPTYNVELSRYSPGFLHWIEMLQAAPSHGIRRIDLACGPEPFKRRLMSGAVQVFEGTVDTSPAVAAGRHAAWRIRRRVQDSRLGGLASVAADAAYRFRSWLAVR